VKQTQRTPQALERPMPNLKSPFQAGIADPQWPRQTPPSVRDEDYERYRGGIAKQDFLFLVAADVVVDTRTGLRDVMERVSAFSRNEMTRKPSKSHLLPLTRIPESYRVTVTVGLGPSLFLDRYGGDRFGLRRMRPDHLKPMPRFTGDAATFDPDSHATDLLFIIASDSPYVSIAIARSIAHTWVDPRLRVRWMEQGFCRPDTREFLKFEDGTDNIRNNTDDHTLDRLTFVHKGDDLEWCTNGSYLVYRKVRENLPVWESLDRRAKEQAIGREEISGMPLTDQSEPNDPRQPVWHYPRHSGEAPYTAHIRKVQPRRPGPDFTGIHDLDRRFLRRPYPFFEGLDANGDVSVGLHFIAFMRNIRDQFEWAVQMWQTNPDFPEPHSGMDTMYAQGILSNVGGGYYFCPPGPHEGFLANQLF
jgi:deferrochelatase/peroxidase EfeB